jgi:hypothetical protein
MESKSIEVLNLKMQASQFVSVMTVIQMKLMKAIHKRKNMIFQES